MTGPHLTPEREADPLRAALVASTELLAITLGHVSAYYGYADLHARIDAQIQANQVALQLAVAEADKPHDGNER